MPLTSPHLSSPLLFSPLVPFLTTHLSITEEEQLVEHVEHLRGGLVHRQHDRLALLHRVLLQVLDETVGGARVETRARLLLNKEL